MDGKDKAATARLDSREITDLMALVSDDLQARLRHIEARVQVLEAYVRTTKRSAPPGSDRIAAEDLLAAWLIALSEGPTGRPDRAPDDVRRWAADNPGAIKRARDAALTHRARVLSKLTPAEQKVLGL